MSIRKVEFAIGNFYHIYNRGVEKRTIFEELFDTMRFFKSMILFNSIEPIGSIYEHAFPLSKNKKPKSNPLVGIVAYCLNPNHFHLILTPKTNKGIQTFMHRLGTGYTMYFNEKYKRSGSLFQGVFKATHIDSNEFLLHVSVYINLNTRTHQLGGEPSKLVKSSWDEYISKDADGVRICDKDIIIEQFRSPEKYKKFALSSLDSIIERKTKEKEWQATLID